VFALCRPKHQKHPEILAQSHPLPVNLSVGDIRSQISAEWLQIAQRSQWRAYRKLPSLFLMVPSLTPTTSSSPYAPRYANGHISATGDPIHFMVGSRVGLWHYFRLHQFQVGGRSPSWIISNGHISATAHSIHLHSAHRAVIFATAQLSCKSRFNSDAITHVNNVFKFRKSPSDGRRDVPHGKNVGKSEISHDGASYHATFGVNSVYHGSHVYGHTIRPRQRTELLPEPRNHHGYVEAKHKCHRDKVVVFLTVCSQILEHPVQHEQPLAKH